jgi:hypothetical protein
VQYGNTCAETNNSRINQGYPRHDKQFAKFKEHVNIMHREIQADSGILDKHQRKKMISS